MPDRQYYDRRKGALEQERQSFLGHYRELSEFVRPRRGRFFVQDRNKGDKRYQSIINSKATQAHKIATAGMLAGTMSPSRPWFKLETLNQEMMESAPIKDWLHKVEILLRSILNSSNFYGMASNMIDELLLFGTGAMSHEDDFEDVARFYTHTVGSYMIGVNDRQDVDTFVREFEWTVIQIVNAFGLENVSTQVKTAYDKGDYDKWFKVVHFVEPNTDRRTSSKLSEDKPFKSVYFEPGTEREGKNKLLSVKGFDEFPVYVPRWDLTGEDIYGTDCPGMTALGDIKGLQIEEKRKAQAIDKLVNPPLSGPPSVRNTPVTSLPGGLTVYDGGNGQTLTALYQIDPNLQELRADMDAVERRIDKAFFVDMFLAITNIEGIQPRNQLDLMQRNEERLLQLGPVLERLQSDFLDPMIDRVFNQAVKADILPTPPEELQSQPLRVQYVSTLAMAQRAIATQSIDRLTAFVGQLMQLGFPDAQRKYDAGQAVDEYARAVGTPPSLIVPDEIVEQQKQQAAQQQQMQQALEQGQGAANIAKMASDSKLDDDNALSRTIDEQG